MAIRRTIVILSSIILILIIAISLSTSLEIRSPSQKIIQISIAQSAKDAQFDREIDAKGRINATGVDRGGILSGTSTISTRIPSTLYISVKPTATSIDEEGMIGETQTTQPTPTSFDEGYIGPIETSQTALPTPQPSPGPQFPILALSYTGSGGPKHCRGDLIQKLSLPRPASAWKNGTCIDLPTDARCGVFFAGKDDNCEAQLFNMNRCLNTTQTFVNTVVFMPEERTVGALWRSMWVRCGVDAPEAGLLDPSILGGLLKKPGGG